VSTIATCHGPGTREGGSDRLPPVRRQNALSTCNDYEEKGPPPQRPSGRAPVETVGGIKKPPGEGRLLTSSKGGCWGLCGSLAGDDRDRRFEHDEHVEPEVLVLDVPHVQLDRLVEVRRAAPRDLPPAGQAGQGIQALAVPRLVHVDLVLDRRARANHADVPLE